MHSKRADQPQGCKDAVGVSVRNELQCRESGFVQSSKSICKEIALQRPKTGKFDYLSAPGHSAHSMASEFFTDDCLAGILMAGWDKEAPMSADWTKRHRGGVIRSC